MAHQLVAAADLGIDEDDDEDDDDDDGEWDGGHHGP